MLNDCNAGVLGEKTFGVYKDLDTLFYLTISSGIGGGVYTNGKVLEGRGNAVEVGHFFVSDRYEHKCGCGGIGHWEGLASGNNIPGFFAEWLKKYGKILQKEHESCEKVLELCRKSNLCKNFLSTLRIINGRGISELVKAYDPDIILVSGSVALNNWDLLFSNLEIESTLLSPPPIVKATLGADAPILGALAAIQEYVKNI